MNIEIVMHVTRSWKQIKALLNIKKLLEFLVRQSSTLSEGWGTQFTIIIIIVPIC